MAYVTVEDVAATWEQYERSRAALVDPTPAGLILHAAGKTDEGYRIVDVWESEAACERFRSRRPLAGCEPAPAVAMSRCVSATSDPTTS